MESLYFLHQYSKYPSLGVLLPTHGCVHTETVVIGPKADHWLLEQVSAVTLVASITITLHIVLFGPPGFLPDPPGNSFRHRPHSPVAVS